VHLVSRGGGSLRLRSIALLLGRPGISISSSKADSNSSRWCGFLTRRGFLSIVDDKTSVGVYPIRHLLCLIMNVIIMLQYRAAGAAYFRGHNGLKQVAGKHTCSSDWHCCCRCRLSTESSMIKEQGRIGSMYVQDVLSYCILWKSVLDSCDVFNKVEWNWQRVLSVLRSGPHEQHAWRCMPMFLQSLMLAARSRRPTTHRLSTASIVPKLKSSSSSKPGSSPRGFFSSILMRRSSSFSASMATAAAAFLAAS